MRHFIKRIGSDLLSCLPHVNITLAVVLMVLFVTDRFNRAMAFINNDITKWMLCVFCVTSFIQAIVYAYYRRKAFRKREAEDTKTE